MTLTKITEKFQSVYEKKSKQWIKESSFYPHKLIALDQIIKKRSFNLNQQSFFITPIKQIDCPLYIIVAYKINEKIMIWSYPEQDWNIRYLLDIITVVYPNIIFPKSGSLIETNTTALSQIENAFKTGENLVFDGDKLNIDLKTFIYSLVYCLQTLDVLGGYASALLSFGINLDAEDCQIQYHGNTQNNEWIDIQKCKDTPQLKGTYQEQLQAAYKIERSHKAFQLLTSFLTSEEQHYPNFKFFNYSQADQRAVIRLLLAEIKKGQQAKKQRQALSFIKYTQSKQYNVNWNMAWQTIYAEGIYQDTIKQIFILRNNPIQQNLMQQFDQNQPLISEDPVFKEDFDSLEQLLYFIKLPYQSQFNQNNQLKKLNFLNDQNDTPFLAQKAINFLCETQEISHHLGRIEYIVSHFNEPVFDYLYSVSMYSQNTLANTIDDVIFRFVLLKNIMDVIMGDYELGESLFPDISTIKPIINHLLPLLENKIDELKRYKNCSKTLKKRIKRIDKETQQIFEKGFESAFFYSNTEQSLSILEKGFVYIVIAQYIEQNKFERLFNLFMPNDFADKKRAKEIQEICIQYATSHSDIMEHYFLDVEANRKSKLWTDRSIGNKQHFIYRLITFDCNNPNMPKFVQHKT